MAALGAAVVATPALAFFAKVRSRHMQSTKVGMADESLRCDLWCCPFFRRQ